MSTFTSLTSFEHGLGALLLLNLFDAASTSAWVASGVATEANPIMAMALNSGHGAFVLGKVALVGLGVAMLWRLRDRREARLALVPLALLYAFVGGSHIGIALGVAGLV